MKRDIIYTIFFFLPLMSYGQSEHSPRSLLKTSNNPVSLNVTIPMDQSIEFTSENDINYGKTYSGYYKLTVSSDDPWVVSIMAKTSLFTPSSSTASNNMPASIMSLKESSKPNFISLSETPQNLLMSDNSNINGNFSIDLYVNPSWNYKGGSYYEEILFTLSVQ